MYFYQARYYDGALGRFIQADTIVPDPANPQSLNRYSYCLNNPLKFIDPTGHSTETPGGDKPWWIPDAVGLRVEGSLAPFSFLGDAFAAAMSETVLPAVAVWSVTHVAVDFNIDIVFNFHDQTTGELSLPRSTDEARERIDVFRALGGQALTEGWGASGGVLLLYNSKDNSAFEGTQFEVGGSPKANFGPEVAVFTDLAQSPYPLGVFIGIGFGQEVSAGATLSHLKNITDWFFDQLNQLSEQHMDQHHEKE